MNWITSHSYEGPPNVVIIIVTVIVAVVVVQESLSCGRSGLLQVVVLVVIV